MTATFPLPIDDILAGLNEIIEHCSHCNDTVQIGTVSERVTQLIEDRALGMRNMIVALRDAGHPTPVSSSGGIEALRAALGPFARAADNYEFDIDPLTLIGQGDDEMTVGDLRRAEAAFKAGSGGSSGWQDLRLLVENAAYHIVEDWQANLIAALEIMDRMGVPPYPTSPSPSSNMLMTDEMVEAARFTLSGICGFAITSATVRRTLESALSAATEGK